ncbi:MAG: 50S ribosomal protein L6 [Spirochaetota bacterium]
MSRIGVLPIAIPNGVTVDVKPGLVSVKGPKGELSQTYSDEVTIEVQDTNVVVSRKNETKVAKSKHGLYRNLVRNMVVGVSDGYTKSLLINGVGYRAEVQGQVLVLNLGYSNPVEYPIPEGLSITCDGPTKVIVSGISKQRVGQVASEIRSVRPPEPYKGKGVRYEDEYVRRKVGKAGVK